jgi:Domain of unknown function (DUF4389)
MTTDTIEQPHPAVVRPRWLRVLYLVFFLIAFGFGQSILCFITVVQFVWLLATGEPNASLRRFGTSLARWFSDVVRFLTCASDEKPFPWKDWPAAD